MTTASLCTGRGWSPGADSAIPGSLWVSFFPLYNVGGTASPVELIRYLWREAMGKVEYWAEGTWGNAWCFFLYPPQPCTASQASASGGGLPWEFRLFLGHLPGMVHFHLSRKARRAGHVKESIDFMKTRLPAYWHLHFHWKDVFSKSYRHFSCSKTMIPCVAFVSCMMGKFPSWSSNLIHRHRVILIFFVLLCFIQGCEWLPKIRSLKTE